MFTENPQVTATTTPAASQLPAGHDDTTSPWYIAPELREHYVPATPQDIWTHFYDPENGRNRRNHVAEARMRQDPRWREYFAHEDKRTTARRRGDYPMAQHHQAEGFFMERGNVADQLTPDELAITYHRTVALPAAARAHAADQRAAQARATREAAQLCSVCGAVSPTTRAVHVDWDAASIATVKGGAATPRNLCGHCTAVAAQQVATARSDDLVDGQTRSEAVAAWLRDW